MLGDKIDRLGLGWIISLSYFLFCVSYIPFKSDYATCNYQRHFGRHSIGPGSGLPAHRYCRNAECHDRPPVEDHRSRKVAEGKAWCDRRLWQKRYAEWTEHARAQAPYYEYRHHDVYCGSFIGLPCDRFDFPGGYV